MSEQIKVLLRLERKPEIDEVLQVLSEMTLEEQKMMFVFMQGVKFAKGMERKMVTSAIVQSQNRKKLATKVMPSDGKSRIASNRVDRRTLTTEYEN